MAEFEMKNDSGSLFRVEERKSERHPSHSGQAKIDDTEYWVAAWVNTSKGGKKYFSMQFTLKDKPNTGKPIDDGEFDDDIPF